MFVRRILPVLCFLLAGVLLLPVTWTRSGQAAPLPPTPSSTPGSPGAQGVAPPARPIHVPYDPSVRSDKLPAYPYNELYPARIGALPAAARPGGPDLDVTTISRTPTYSRYEVWYTPELKPFLRPGTEDDRRWPAPGEEVIFTAHFANKGTAPSGPFFFRWYIDGTEVAGGIHDGLAPGEQAETSYSLPWMHSLDGERLVGTHTIRFAVDPENAVAEPYELNNSLEDRTDAVSLVLAVTPELYEALETPVDPKWPFSAEDWLQKQIAAMNQAFAASVYPSTPDGVSERVRLDKILVTSTEPPADMGEDGGFFMSGDDRQGNPYYHPATDVSGALLHELSHQLGVIDLYNFGFEMLTLQILDRNGLPVQMEIGLPPTGLMLNPGIDPPIYEEHSALALNSNKGYRRGYYGEYLFDLPQQVSLRVLDNTGMPAAGVSVKLYQSGPGRDLYPTLIDDVPEITGATDAAGILRLPNRPVGDSVTTRTGHTLRDNPFGVVDIIGERDEFVVELAREAHQEYAWFEITRLNLAAWRGELAATTIDVESHVPRSGAPAPPGSLDGEEALGMVTLRWPDSPSAGVVSYNVYRTRFHPDFTYDRVATGVTKRIYGEPYDYGQRAVTYAVTAVNAQGRESGFSPFFNAFSLVNPAAIAVDQSGGRIVLDPQNGYAVLYQAPDGRWLDTLGSVHHHLEYSWYLARDRDGRLIFSHPGDWYSGRQSVKVTDRNNEPLFEFGEYGTGPGQFRVPTGVAVWGQPCTIEGPQSPDEHTLLLLHFDGSYDGAQGEQGTASGTTFTDGKYGQGVTVDADDLLTYPTAGNLNRTRGAIEFWVRPDWDGNDDRTHNFFEVGDGWQNRIRITKDAANNLKVLMWDTSTECGVAYNVADWRAGEWRHVAAIWDNTSVALSVDGQERTRNAARPPDMLSETLSVGAARVWVAERADAAIDEFRISDVPRVGNSDTCSYRILVADNANGRIQAFDEEGRFVSAYGAPGSGPGQFNDLQGLAVDDRGRVIAADSGNNRLQLLSFDGRDFGYLRSIGGFNRPTGVWAYGSDRILVADTGSNTVKELIPEGETYVVKEYRGQPVPYNAPRGVAADSDGNLIVADTGNRRIVTLADALPTFTPTPKVTGTPTPTPTPIITASPTPTATPAGCSEQVVNGGFEIDAAWDFPVTASRAGYTTAQAHSGSRSARFGLLPGIQPTAAPSGPPERSLLGEIAPENASFSGGYQTISVPAGPGSATLTFWYRPGTAAIAGDYQRIMLLNPNGYTYIATLMQVLENSPVWRRAAFDLTPFRGQSIVLYFEVYNDNISAGPRTWMFLDDVSVQSCIVRPTPIPIWTPTATPTGTPGDDLMLTGLVYDASVSEPRPIPEAHLFAGTCQQIFTTSAGPDGRYSLFMPGSALNGCSQVTFVVWATGYEKLELDVPVERLRENPQQDFGLWPEVDISVNTTDDELNTDGDCSLREAIQAANTDSPVDACPAGHGADTIGIPPGIYHLSLAGPHEDANTTGDLDILGNLDIVGTDTDATVILGGQLDRVLDIQPGTSVQIVGVTIAGGKTADGPDGEATGGDAEDGGGIFNAGTLTLSRCAVMDNSTGNGGNLVGDEYLNGGPGGNAGNGGGIYNKGFLTITDSMIGGNFTGSGGTGGDAGGIGRAGAGGGIYNAGKLTLTHVTVRKSHTGVGGYLISPPGTEGGPGGDGGGIYNAGDAVIIQSSVENNRAGEGHPAGTHGTAGNGGAGGGIFSTGDLLLRQSTVSGNSSGAGGTGGICGAGGHGGGIVSGPGASLQLINSTVSGNQTGAGGSGLVSGGCPGGNGGGIYTAGDTRAENGTITANRTGANGSGLAGTAGGGGGGAGGGIFNASMPAVPIRNTILAGNTASGGSSDCSGSLALMGHNLFGSGIDCRVVEWVDGGPNIFDRDPRLLPLGEYGGPTLTHALSPGSPAIDAGSCTDSRGDPVKEDQRGVARPLGRNCDIGAFETEQRQIYLPLLLREGLP